MNKTDLLNTLWMLPLDDLDWLQSGLEKIRSLKAELQGSGGCSHAAAQAPISPLEVQPSTPVVNPRTIAASAREPLRPPKPGSLRAIVHRILREADKPLRRAEIIGIVAKIKSLPIDEKLKAKVGEILTCSLDRNIKKVAYGIYRYQEE